MSSRLAPFLVLLTGCYFVALAAVSLLVPARAARFLHGFATTPGRHYLELVLRACAGAAFVLHAPAMRFAEAFTLFGWILVGTTAGLLVVPWSWHQRFASRAVPMALRHLRLVAIASLALGGVVLGALLGSAID